MAECDTAGVLPRQDANVGTCASSFGAQHREFHASTWTGLQILHTAMTMVRSACGTHGIHWSAAGCSTMGCWHFLARLRPIWSRNTCGVRPAAGLVTKHLMLAASRLGDSDLCIVRRWYRNRSLGSNPHRRRCIRMRRTARHLAGCQNRASRSTASPLRRGIGRRHGIPRVPVHRAAPGKRRRTR